MELKFAGARNRMSPHAVISFIWAAVILIVSGAVTLVGVILFFRSLGMDEISLKAARLMQGLLMTALGGAFFQRYIKLNYAIYVQADFKRAMETMKVDMGQFFLLLVLVTVLFPVVWIISMSLDPRDFSRPQGLSLVPPGATLEAYKQVLTKPSPNPVSFLELLRNSLLVAGGTSLFAVIIGTSAAYAFSRLNFPGRRIGMLGFVIVLMIPPGGTLAPLFVLLNALKIRTTLFGLMLAFTSTALPFAIWNMKGFIDSIPYDLEEAAQIDGCSRASGFLRVILPVSLPGISVTALWGFLTGWSEFILSWTFLTNPKTFTLPMILRGMVGQYASGTPWAQFSAMAILVCIPPMILFFFLQKYLIGGLSLGGVKG